MRQTELMKRFLVLLGVNYCDFPITGRGNEGKRDTNTKPQTVAFGLNLTLVILFYINCSNLYAPASSSAAECVFLAEITQISI